MSWVALAAAVSGVIVYAVQADGYQAHTAELNDGGIWVTSRPDGSYGRVNKPIGELDGTIFSTINANLDIVQDGSSVVGVDLTEGLVEPLDPSQMRIPGGEEAPIPGRPAVGMAGGSLAVLDTVSGRLWVTREDPSVGVPSVDLLSEQTEPAATVGEDAALAVGLDGTVYAVSAAEHQLLTISPSGETGFAEPVTDPLPGAPFSDAIAVTAVGGVAAVLDATNGRLSVLGGGDTDVPKGAVLQQPGPSASAALVGAPDGLLSVDLASGEPTTIAGGAAGDPARPVRLGSCRYGAWSGAQGGVVTACSDDTTAEARDLSSDTTDLVFRTNRGQIVLNDRATGHVWDVDSDKPTRLDNWDAFNLESEDNDDESDDERQDQGDRRPPKAVSDNLGARPGRTTILHPLDNDTAPSGRLLAIRSVRPVKGSDADLAISPDGQTVQITLPRNAVSGTSFEYFIDDGRKSISAHATVRIAVSPLGANSEPRLREGFEPRVWTVPAGGTIDVPVLPDWRDPRDGDPVSTVGAEVVSTTGAGPAGSDARVTATGMVRFQAPAGGGPMQVAYDVSDGLGEPVTDVLAFRVQDPKDIEPVAPTANPDVIGGEAGKPITITPLANDLPGADPFTPDAVLALAGEVSDVPGAEVTTNLVKGTVTLRSQTAQTYFLDYQAAYGTADTDTGKIRVDVRAPQNPPPDPVAVPDAVTLFGQGASVVDVLANDIDPAGGLLSVLRAEPLAANQLDLAVVEGRWLRVSARQGDLAPNPQVVRYTVTNGPRTATGQVVVSQRPAPADDAPVTQNDDATVREGSSQAFSVLDNDYSPSGGTLSLVAGTGGVGGNAEEEPAGLLDVQAEGGYDGDVGTAFVSGRTVRYVAPSGLQGPQRFTIRYQAANEQGDLATGKARVTVLPVRAKTNQPPEPPVLEGRTVAGDTIRLRLPGYGVDPDGDPVTILGLDSAPALGSVVRIGADSIEYTAYPGLSGTDEFTYRITDSLGATATGTARVSIASPGPPQPPLAVADSITVAPGRAAVVDVLANDLVAAGGRVTISLVTPPPGVRLVDATGPIEIDGQVTSGLSEGRALDVVYRLTDGLTSTQTTLTVRTKKGFNNPPVVSDAFGEVGDGPSVTVDVLTAAAAPSPGVTSTGSTSGAYDPDGPSEELVVTDVYAPPGITTAIDGGEVTVARGDHPMVVPFRVEDGDGGAATASIYVPAAHSELPFVEPEALIRLKAGQERELDVNDYVTNPSGGQVSLTFKNRIWPSPRTSVEASVVDDTHFRVSAADQYAGPGAVVLEVTTGSTVEDPDGIKAIVSVPVQVGETRPILRCPRDPIEVPQAESVRLDVATICHVWTPDQRSPGALAWSAEFDTESDEGLSALVLAGGVVQVDASAVSRPGDTGTLHVAADDSLPGEIRVRVVRTPPPSLAPIRISSIRAGESQTVDLAPYLIAGVSTPTPTVVAAEQLSHLDVQITASGSSVTISTGAKAHGQAEFRVVMSDVAGSSSADRRAEGRIVLEILGVPDRPGAPVPGKEILDSQVNLDWQAPPSNGAPIDFYEVRNQYGDRAWRCATTSCAITGLRNLTKYRFSVRAHNAVGFSEWSAASVPATPDEEINLGGIVRLVQAGDHFLRIAWTPVETKGGARITYIIRWTGGHLYVSEPRATITGLDNNQQYVFTIRPRNALTIGAGLISDPFQPVGTPETPAPPTVTDQETAGSTGSVSLTWPRVDANGPSPVRYTVYRDGEKLRNCLARTSPNCDAFNMPYDGHVYDFQVIATNAGGKSSPLGPATQWKAAGRPASWGPWSVAATGENNEARADFTVPSSRGAESSLRIYVDGAKVRQVQTVGDARVSFPVPDNLTSHSVYLEVCNERGRCTQSSTKDVQTYGPLAQAHIHSVRSSVDVRTVSWTIEVDSNGSAALLRVTSDKGRDEQFAVPIGVSTFTTQSIQLDFEETENVTVTLSDANPDRGPVSVKASATTDAPPPPRVVGSRGAACNDDPSAGLPACNTGSGGPKCTDASCAFVHLKLTNWRLDVPGTAVFCSVDHNPHRPYDPRADEDTIDFYGKPGGTVDIDCFNALGQTDEFHFTW